MEPSSPTARPLAGRPGLWRLALVLCLRVILVYNKRLQGPSIDSDEMKGIIPRMMDRVFELILDANESIEFTVKVSFMEIYNEKIHDLLDRENCLNLLRAEAFNYSEEVQPPDKRGPEQGHLHPGRFRDLREQRGADEGRDEDWSQQQDDRCDEDEREELS